MRLPHGSAEKSGGVGKLAVLPIPALGLNVADDRERLLELAREPVAVEAERGEHSVGGSEVEPSRGFFRGRSNGAGEDVRFE